MVQYPRRQRGVRAMIRTLTIAAAAAAVGYALGQRAVETPDSRFSRPEVTGDDVVVKDGEAALSDDTRRRLPSYIDHSDVAAHRIEWSDIDEDGRIGR